MHKTTFFKRWTCGFLLLGFMACTTPSDMEPTASQPTLSGFVDVSAASFRISPTEPCLNDTLTLSASGLNRGSLPIFIYDTETPSVRAVTDGVLVGALMVSPLGDGELRFTLSEPYATVEGSAWAFRVGQTYRVGAQTLSGQIQTIASFTLFCTHSTPEA